MKVRLSSAASAHACAAARSRSSPSSTTRAPSRRVFSTAYKGRIRARISWSIAGVLTLTPYDFWRRTHAIHHSTSGNLDRRGIGDIDTLTVDEYLARSRWGRLRYRVYRHPIIMFGIGPVYLFILRHRLPVGLMLTGRRYDEATVLAAAAAFEKLGDWTKM